MQDKSEAMIETVKEYFRRSDAGSPTIVDLFVPDMRFYFPKYGLGTGRQAFAELGRGLRSWTDGIVHDFTDYMFLTARNFVVVEGTTSGKTKSGKTWEAGKTPGGRFCNVFEFDGPLIARVHIYLDPDYTSEDEARFHWGRQGRTW